MLTYLYLYTQSNILNYQPDRPRFHDSWLPSKLDQLQVWKAMSRE